ncbi:Annexin A7 [Sarracenia purpurea var. burkii]
MQCEVISDPTLKPADNFSASVDAEIFKKEIVDGKHPDRDKLVKLWFHRTYDQRFEIENFYNTHLCSYSEDYCPPARDLRSVSERSMDDLYTDSLLPPEKLLGSTVHDAIIGKWKEKGAIEEILCGDDAEMKERIARYYQASRLDIIIYEYY